MLRRAQEAYERYLHILDTYRVLSKSDGKLYQRYVEEKDRFSLIQSHDATTRRDTKISRFKQEKALRLQLEV